MAIFVIMTRSGRKVFILFKNDELVRVWTSLTKLHAYMINEGEFISYSKLVKDYNAAKKKSKYEEFGFEFRHKVAESYNYYLLEVQYLD